MSDAGKSKHPRYVGAAMAAVTAACGPLALDVPNFGDSKAMEPVILRLFDALRELCHVHGIDPDTLWKTAKWSDTP